MTEQRDTRIKRLKMRSMRRGIKEMDLILSAYADANLAGMTTGDLDLYDALLEENDQDLYQWVTGQVAPPDPFGDLVAEIARLREQVEAAQSLAQRAEDDERVDSGESAICGSSMDLSAASKGIIGFWVGTTFEDGGTIRIDDVRVRF